MSTKPKVVKPTAVSSYKGSPVPSPKGMGVTTALGNGNGTVITGSAPQFSAFDPIKNTPGSPDREAVVVKAPLAATPTNSDNTITVVGSRKGQLHQAQIVMGGSTPAPLVRDAKRPALPRRDYSDDGTLTNP